ncbi:MAG: response regulator transcription factor [Gammaproteobacteria bacterium]|nr:response regulator transcription factor [Gammaproteobacteria bacterium]
MMIEPTVYLVDDDLSYRQSLRLLLEEEGFNVEDFDGAAAFLVFYDHHHPGCLVLDVRMPEVSGLELQDHLMEKGVRLPIIFLTGHGDVPMSVKAIKAGAVDFLEKPFDNELLLKSIRAAIATDARMRMTIAERSDIIQRFNRLTRREREVMNGVVVGKANKKIAGELDVSPRTVEVHRARVMQKMAAESIPGLIAMALKADICEIGG